MPSGVLRCQPRMGPVCVDGEMLNGKLTAVCSRMH